MKVESGVAGAAKAKAFREFAVRKREDLKWSHGSCSNVLIGAVHV